MSSSPFIDKLHKHYKIGPTVETSATTSDEKSSKMSTTANSTTRDDERGFQKTQNFTVMDPRQANFQETVKLVERNPCPNGFQLVDPDKSGKKNQFDLVELAANIQTADQFTRATAGSKLTVIAEQVRFLQEQARKVLEDARLNALLHKTACNFNKVPGKTYYVYKQRANPD